MPDDIHNAASSLREQYLEYALLGTLCQEIRKRGMEMDILRSHTDRNGYDILLEANSIQRHVQLKSSFVGAKTSRQKINVKLAEKPSGCVIWVWFDPASLEVVDYLWFGAEPGQPVPDLGSRIGRHAKGNSDGYKAERSDIRVLNKGQFATIMSAQDLADHLFGVTRPYQAQ
jgi:hypothetical protein